MSVVPLEMHKSCDFVIFGKEFQIDALQSGSVGAFQCSIIIAIVVEIGLLQNERDLLEVVLVKD